METKLLQFFIKFNNRRAAADKGKHSFLHKSYYPRNENNWSSKTRINIIKHALKDLILDSHDEKKKADIADETG